MSVVTKEMRDELEAVADSFGKVIDKHDFIRLNEDEYIFGERSILCYRKIRGLVASMGRYLETGELPPKGAAQPPKATR